MPTLLVLSFLLAPIQVRADAEVNAETSWPLVLRSELVRLGAMEFALRKGAQGACTKLSQASGMTLDYLGAYNRGDQDLVARMTGLGALPVVIGVAVGSPAYEAGIRPGDELEAIGPKTIGQVLAEMEHPSLLSGRLEDLLAQQSADRPTELSMRRDGISRVVNVHQIGLCATRFVLKTGGGMNAYGDSDRVAITSKILKSAQDDNELAIIAGHEFAHIVAGDSRARNLKLRRAMEDRADLLGVDLARCAGFDAASGLDWWRRYNRKDWKRWLRGPSHRNTHDRIELMEEHLADVPSPHCPPQVPALEV
ncbi:M48 family metalloprotease [Novosphingobium sp. MBES04]|uniref:M48 family metalloprotease n=1 Tax=Novosphingobium sp. MBES04 TaxID=1206458 RepID=UPI00057D7229|nr:M48 family metalloprotease [Novosphingobium sp. MBES04]